MCCSVNFEKEKQQQQNGKFIVIINLKILIYLELWYMLRAFTWRGRLIKQLNSRSSYLLFSHISYTSWPSSVTRVHLHAISAVDELVAPEKAIKWTLRISLGHNIVVTVKPPDSVNWGKRKRIFSCSCNVRDTQMTEHVNVREHCVVSEKTDCFSAGCVDTFYKTLMRCTIRAQPSS